jgi:hypothetical protein
LNAGKIESRRSVLAFIIKVTIHDNVRGVMFCELHKKMLKLDVAEFRLDGSNVFSSKSATLTGGGTRVLAFPWNRAEFCSRACN